ncbi:MAG: acetate--CoA ligase family protein [Roseobacter sp.]
MTRDLSRLLHPTSIAVVGGGAWCQQVVLQSKLMGFSGEIYRVHPACDTVEGITAVATVAHLPKPPDAVFLGINRMACVDTVAALSSMGAGGAVCFASGFAEASAEDANGNTLQAQLVAAAGDMPILGPNCYGFVNALDGALLWPDQHGCTRVTRGVAILTQSSNIAINLTMQQRALPIAFTVTCGNVAQTSQAEIAMGLLDDPRVTAIGLHVEGFGDIALWHELAHKAYAKGVPLIVLKVGVSDHAQRATVSHTASLAGSDAGASALLDRLGIPRVYDLTTFLETLMLLHCNGALSSTALSSISCSGGEASLVADVAAPFDVQFPTLTVLQKAALADALGPMVALSNPLDYHTYVWNDLPRMIAAWRPMAAEHIALVLIILDYPHTDPSAWENATRAAIAVRRETGRPVAVVATLPELLPQAVATELLAAGVTPLHGLTEALGAAAAATRIKPPAAMPPLHVSASSVPVVLSEADAKGLLAQHGVKIPNNVIAQKGQLAALARDLNAPLVLKALGLAHKSEAGGLRLKLQVDGLEMASESMPGDTFLIEEMVEDTVAELLVGVTRDTAHGFLMTVAAGGVLTELLKDRASFLLPADRQTVGDALQKLRIYPQLTGYRGAIGADLNAVLDAIMAVQDYVVADKQALYEVEINPLMCTPQSAIAADALIARLDDTQLAGETDGPD